MKKIRTKKERSCPAKTDTLGAGWVGESQTHPAWVQKDVISVTDRFGRFRPHPVSAGYEAEASDQSG